MVLNVVTALTDNWFLNAPNKQDDLNTSQVDFLIQTYKFVAKFIKHMIFKIFGAILILVGIFLIAKYQLYLVGLILLFLGFYLAMKIGMKTL
jgi:VIT1/CCC1 family predicted Fe2+/Mn2+ transporter